MSKEQFKRSTPTTEQIREIERELSTPEWSGSRKREANYERLSPQQLEILKRCSLTLVENNEERSSTVSGTIEDGRSIEMIIDRNHEITVKIDGNIVSDDNERKDFVNKYWRIARASSETH